MSKIRVLLVDDEEAYVKTLAERMEMRDVESQVALSGEEALKILDEGDPPDVMVLDLRMPGLQGLEVLERVKKDFPHIEVIILTGHGGEEEEKEAERLGAFHYLQKPADTSLILRTVRSAWQKSVQAAVDFVKDSRQEFDRSMTAAALAQAGATDAAREVMREEPPDSPEVEEGPQAESLKVLLVDDEEDFVRTMAERMEMRDLGSDVALDGETALEMLDEEIPDVMVLDLRMPGIGGMEVLRRVKKTYPQVQVIIMTGHGSDDEEAEARSLGAYDYLRKPVDITHLMETIRGAGRAKGSP
jgi:DNA-binding NtrC family response regulator